VCVSGAACQQSTSQAAAPQTTPSPTPQVPYDHQLTDAARVLAGMLPEDPQRFTNVTSQASWQAFHKEMDDGWVADTEKRTKLVDEWRDRELGPLVTGCRTLMYPFGGPDILNAYQFFPKCESYVLFGLEQLGTVPQLDKMTPADADKLVSNLREALSDLFTRHYFITKSMETELTANYVNGTLPVVLLMLARLDAHIVSIERVTLAENGIAVANVSVATPSPAAGAPAAPSPVRAYRVTFVPAGSDRQQTAIYFRAQAENAGLKKVVAAYLRQLTPATTMLKAASYLLHDEQFSTIRSVILESSVAILQDDSGMPYRFLNKPEWRLRLYGKYSKPIQDFNYGFQPDLQAAYTKANPVELPFSYGYHWRDGSFGVMIATRVGPETTSGKH
jgi:hypothetical protein